MTADPCLPSDLAPRPMHDLVSRGRGLGLLGAGLATGRTVAEFRSLTANTHRNHLSLPLPHSHCPQLGIPFADLPMCQ